MVLHVNSLSITADGPGMSVGCRREWSGALICDTAWSWFSGHRSDGSEVGLDGLSGLFQPQRFHGAQWHLGEDSSAVPEICQGRHKQRRWSWSPCWQPGWEKSIEQDSVLIGSTEGYGHFPFCSFLLTTDRCRVQCYEYPSCPDVVKPKCYQACSEGESLPRSSAFASVCN